MDIESVIEQLELTIDLIKQNGKDWWDERDIPVLEKAIEALKKQIPIQVGYKQKQYGEYFYCPECRHTVKWIRDYEYCAYCGKAIEFPDLVSKDTNDLWLTEETLEGET